MNGDAHAPGTGGSQPLPPAFPERTPRRLESAAEQALHPPFFAAPASAPAQPAWGEPSGQALEEAPRYAAEPELGAAVTAEETLPTPEDFGYQEPAAEEVTVGEIPADAFLETAPPPTYEEPALEAPALPSYEEAVYAEPALPTYEEPAYVPSAQPAYDAPVYAEPAPAVYEEPAASAPPLQEASATPETQLADRLETLARELRNRGSEAINEAFAGDALDAALAGLISGYLAGRGR